MTTLQKTAVFLLIVLVLLILGCQALVRSSLFYPTHEPEDPALTPWMQDGSLIGFARTVPDPENVWLMLHGNGGQASHRGYMLDHLPARDALYVLEYPGFGSRPGTPSRASFDAAALSAYQALRAQFPGKPVCVLTESIGSGPGSTLARAAPPPDKFVLIVPFDILKSVAHDHVPYLPTSLILAGSWNNVESLADYAGPIEVFGAEGDPIIPVAHARNLAASRPQAQFHLVRGGHMDWVQQPEVRVHNP
jgi:pimeloyl-ACP methyl ester carboxylesterase